jgi:hypothetical protein
LHWVPASLRRGGPQRRSYAPRGQERIATAPSIAPLDIPSRLLSSHGPPSRPPSGLAFHPVLFATVVSANPLYGFERFILQSDHLANGTADRARIRATDGQDMLLLSGNSAGAHKASTSDHHLGRASRACGEGHGLGGGIPYGSQGCLGHVCNAPAREASPLPRRGSPPRREPPVSLGIDASYTRSFPCQCVEKVTPPINVSIGTSTSHPTFCSINRSIPYRTDIRASHARVDVFSSAGVNQHPTARTAFNLMRNIAVVSLRWAGRSPRHVTRP